MPEGILGNTNRHSTTAPVGTVIIIYHNYLFRNLLRTTLPKLSSLVSGFCLFLARVKVGVVELVQHPAWFIFAKNSHLTVLVSEILKDGFNSLFYFSILSDFYVYAIFLYNVFVDSR